MLSLSSHHREKPKVLRLYKSIVKERKDGDNKEAEGMLELNDRCTKANVIPI